MFVFYYNINKYIIQSLRDEGFDPCVGKIPLEEELATHSSIFAWKIPAEEEPVV